MDDEAIGGPILGAEHHRVKAYPCDRVCEHKGCSTRLSLYNPGSLCVVHDERGVPLYVHHPRLRLGEQLASRTGLPQHRKTQDLDGARGRPVR